MMSENPAGRLDILCVRLLDKWAQNALPPELWQFARPQAEEFIRNLLGPTPCQES